MGTCCEALSKRWLFKNEGEVFQAYKSLLPANQMPIVECDPSRCKPLEIGRLVRKR